MKIFIVVLFLFYEIPLNPIQGIVFHEPIDLPSLEISDLPDYPIGDYMFFSENSLEVSGKSIFSDFNQMDFQALEHEVIFNQGFSDKTWWFAFKVKNNLDQKNKVIFSPAGSGVRLASLYSFDEKGNLLDLEKTGLQVPQKERKIETRINSFLLNFEPNQTKIYFLHLDTEGLSSFSPFFLDSEKSYWEYEVGRGFGYGTVAGILIMAILLGLFLLFYLKERVYLFFILFVFTSLILILEEDGFGYLFFYRDVVPKYLEISVPLFSLLSSVFFLEFIILFLNQSIKSSILRLLINPIRILSVLVGVLLLVNLFSPETGWFWFLIVSVSFVLSIGNFIIAFFMMISRRNFKDYTIYFFLLASLILISGMLNYYLNIFGITTFTIFKPNGIVFGCIVLVVVLSLGVINRYYFLKNEKQLLDKEVLESEKRKLDEIFKALENERIRIAKDLHDDLGALLTLSKFKINSIQSEPLKGEKELKYSLKEAIGLLDLACQDVKFIAHELMPVEFQQKQLEILVKEIIEAVQTQNKIHFVCDIGDLPLLDPVLKMQIFRILKELLNNILKHSRASAAEISLFFDEEDHAVSLLVIDNGVGFDVLEVSNSQSGLGISSIKKRVKHLGGDLSIDSGKEGTQICVQVPVIKKNDEKKVVDR